MWRRTRRRRVFGRRITTRLWLVGICLSLLAIASSATAQQNESAQQLDAAAKEGVSNTPTETTPPKKIAEGPETIDPAEVLPKALTERVTVDFADSSLDDLVRWLKTERDLVVVADRQAFLDIDIRPDSAWFSERLENEPLYFLLERLRDRDIAWYMRGDVLYLTTVELADEAMVTAPYSIAHLVASGYDPVRLSELVRATIWPDVWEAGTECKLTVLGDVLFVRVPDRMHYQIAGLLKALASPAERTFIHEPTVHTRIREKLKQRVSVTFRETPLSEAVKELASQVNIPIRLDKPRLVDEGVDMEMPITLDLQNVPLRTVLDVLPMKAWKEVSWELRDGVLWITGISTSASRDKTAVYDIGDLCRNDRESRALVEMLKAQTSQEYWYDLAGREGPIEIARSGVLVAYAPEKVHDALLSVLRSYREALSQSRASIRDLKEPVVTGYYRVPEVVADDLIRTLPELVGSSEWRREGDPPNVGTIRRLASAPEVVADASHSTARARTGTSQENGKGKTKRRGDVLAEAPASSVAAVPYVVIVVQQRRSVQHRIRQIVDRVLHGDPVVSNIGGGGLGGGF